MPAAKLNQEQRMLIWNDYKHFEKNGGELGKQKWLDKQAEKYEVSVTTIINTLNRFQGRKVPRSKNPKVKALNMLEKLVDLAPTALIKGLKGHRQALLRDLEIIDKTLEALGKSSRQA